jgi:Raf kinase inhibitor-like YbhB/YbcL family protein
MSLQVRSSSFEHNSFIPQKHAYRLRCLGDNISPALQWTPGPEGTKSYAIVMYDPDAVGGFVHWMVYNIPPTITSLPEMKDGTEYLPRDALLCTNDFPFPGYGGMCPPTGKPHHYEFSVYALSKKLPYGLEARQVSSHINQSLLAKGTLIGLYQT